MKLQNNQIEADVKEELADLAKVLEIISQVPRTTAYRIIKYCAAYIEVEKPEVSPLVGKMTDAFIKKMS